MIGNTNLSSSTVTHQPQLPAPPCCQVGQPGQDAAGLVHLPGQELGGGAGVVHHRQAVAGCHQWAGRPGRHLPRQLLQSDWNLFPQHVKTILRIKHKTSPLTCQYPPERKATSLPVVQVFSLNRSTVSPGWGPQLTPNLQPAPPRTRSLSAVINRTWRGTASSGALLTTHLLGITSPSSEWSGTAISAI